MPAIGVSGGTPAAARWAGESVDALIVTMPTRFPGGSIACTDGTCISAEVATGTPAAARKFALEQTQESAVGGERLGAQTHQFLRRRDEVREQSARAIHHDFRGTGAAHDPVQHGKGPRRAVAHVAGDARKTASSIRMPSGTP